MSAIESPAPIETKSAGGDYLDLKDAFGDFMTTFKAFKESNDEKLAELEGRLGVAREPHPRGVPGLGPGRPAGSGAPRRPPRLPLGRPRERPGHPAHAVRVGR